MHVSMKGNMQAFEMQSTIPRAEYSIQANERICETQQCAHSSIHTGWYPKRSYPFYIPSSRNDKLCAQEFYTKKSISLIMCKKNDVQ